MLGYGIGLRAPHYASLLEPGAALPDWFEAITENYADTQGRPLRVLEAVRRDRPVALHGVSLSLGSTDPLDEAYVDRLAALVRRIEPAIVSDHLCWTSVGGHHLHDLLPLPMTEEAARHAAERIVRVQDRLGRRIAIENVSAYVAFRDAEMDEADFVATVVRRADCDVLLDVNNAHVNAVNFGAPALALVHRLPRERVRQIHLAGHADHGTYLFDTHDAPVCDAVWALYADTIRHLGREVPTLVEWDAAIPPFERVLAETERARGVARAALAVPHAGAR